MKTTRIYKADSLVTDYIAECAQRGYHNNSSLAAMKWDWCLETGAWHATYVDGRIVSITGVHEFQDGVRALFRGAQLSTRPINGLCRYQMQSWGIYAHLPLQIEFAKGKPLYITTNISDDPSGRMNRIHKSFKVIEKSGMISHVADEEIFNTQQSVWLLNKKKYFEIRKRYED
jgi:hypothetical protein